ncbi:MAG: hypothetical protein GWN84_17695 [Gammaproteobacteria bacterium]|nr:hypothetical protein [Gammaproteobacteria bacterium]NIR88937.1 hypothetical protein [Gammaproteobacteria bacterium]NIU05226.1 hypothetical protein [Gammaproteobacteria bacterium]NIV52841.1 hypothetical protein [Gammaproteobacteria bacterium]NIW85137.1 hypothetical protein [Gammaproteobacteria bacterium]
MKAVDRIRFLFRISGAQGIARRYVVTNGFDGALTMLGLNMGFYASGGIAPTTAISACLGAAIALGVSGLTSAYVSEAAEKWRELRELERALVRDMRDTEQRRAAHLVPFLIAVVNGLSPLVVSLVIITPFWAAQAGIRLPVSPVEASIGLAFVAIFFLGVFTGRVSGVFWLWAGLRTLLIAFVTSSIIFFLAG